MSSPSGLQQATRPKGPENRHKIARQRKQRFHLTSGLSWGNLGVASHEFPRPRPELAAPLSSGVFAFLGLRFSRIVATRHGRESPESTVRMPQALIHVENFVK